MRLFEFDFDVNWYVFFLNADETIYGRYGGRDASDPESRISFKGLRSAMANALEVHANPPKSSAKAAPIRAENYLAAKRHRGCIHCHNVNEFRRADLKAAGKWDRESVWVYPLPENIGLRLDIDAGNLIRQVEAGSAADAIGMKPGDRLRSLDGKPVASFADASYALHKAPAVGSITISWERSGQAMSGTITLADGWKKTNLTWRPSMLDLLPAVPFAGDDLTAAEKRRLGLAPDRAAFKQSGRVHSTLAASGIRLGDVIVGVDGTSVTGEIGDLLGYVRRNYLVNDVVTFDVLRDGQPVKVRHVLK